MFNIIYKNRLLEIRDQKSLSDEEFCSRINNYCSQNKINVHFSEEDIHDIDCGCRCLSVEEAIAICKFFSITLDYLCGIDLKNRNPSDGAKFIAPTPHTKRISADDLLNHDGEPIYTVFPYDSLYEPEWGIMDAENGCIIYPDTKLKLPFDSDVRTNFDRMDFFCIDECA